jgi:hypothetical protein
MEMDDATRRRLKTFLFVAGAIPRGVQMANQQTGLQPHQGTDKEKDKENQANRPGHQQEQSEREKSGQHGDTTSKQGQQGDTKHDRGNKR